MRTCEKFDQCLYPINCERRKECIALVESGELKQHHEFKDVLYNNGIGRVRNGHPIFYDLLKEMAETHDKKSHDYASNSSPFANYKFAGMMSKVFNDPDDSGFLGRIGEKIYRLANLENSGKQALNESIEDTEKDIATIIVLWMAMRRERRQKNEPIMPGSIQYFGEVPMNEWKPQSILEVIKDLKLSIAAPKDGESYESFAVRLVEQVRTQILNKIRAV